MSRERVEQSDRAQASLVTKLLDVLDDMDRLSAEGTAAPRPSRCARPSSWSTASCGRSWRRRGSSGSTRWAQPFDPSVHEAVSAVPPPTPDLDHTVSATFQTGYRFKGALVRPARVQVYSTQGQA